MNIPIYAVIMAGGQGTRFWPKSRNRLPKQFLKIIGDKTMIQHTVQRIEPLVPYENTIILTNANQANIVYEQLPFLPSENVILEPIGRNTAPCIGLAALIVQQRNQDGIMLVLPSDHWINDKKRFCLELKIAADRVAEKETLIALGIKPAYPETGYGYIQFGQPISTISEYEIYQIKEFREKPDVTQATEFIKCGNYLWNGGIFVWKAATILEEMEKYLPHLHKGLMKIKTFLGTDGEQNEINEFFKTLNPESIDYGVMEKTKRAEIIISQAGWSDVGSWKSLENLLPSDQFGNIASPNHLLFKTHNSIIKGDKRLIAAIHLDDMIIIDTEDVLLVCPKNRCQEIKKLVESLKEAGKDEFL